LEYLSGKAMEEINEKNMNNEFRPSGTKIKYVYGPVPSRRIGRSLGVDLVPFKICNYDCIYCQLGRTTSKTMERKEYISPELILRDLHDKLSSGDKPDYITISGSGEPTLNSSLDEVISKIKKMTDIPLAVLTNGSLLHLSEIRKSCCEADLVLPSLDAGEKSMFKHVNRPCKEIEFDEMVEGLIKLREEYDGRIWLEVFLLGGVNSLNSDVMKIKTRIDKIKPDKVQINTVARPPAENYALRVDYPQLVESCKLLGDNAEIIAGFTGQCRYDQSSISKNDILTLISRRPCSLEDIARGLNAHPNEIIKYIDTLISNGIVEEMRHSGKIFYFCKKTDTGRSPKC